jgi:hypothetical protein
MRRPLVIYDFATVPYTVYEEHLIFFSISVWTADTRNYTPHIRGFKILFVIINVIVEKIIKVKFLITDHLSNTFRFQNIILLKI